MPSTLSLLDLARGLHIAVGNVHETKPLCENIFDVPRSELLETYERLRETFWRDPVESTAPSTRLKSSLVPADLVQSQPQQATPVAAATTAQPQARKRRASESPEPFGKQHKLAKSDYTHNEMMASAVSSSIQTMWGYKKWFIRQLRRDKQNFKEETILARLDELEGLLVPMDKRNLAQYLQSVLESLGMRKTPVDVILATWLTPAPPPQQPQGNLENEL